MKAAVIAVRAPCCDPDPAVALARADDLVRGGVMGAAGPRRRPAGPACRSVRRTRHRAAGGAR